jgi:hypothetical protein
MKIENVVIISALLLVVSLSSCASTDVNSRRVSTAERGIKHFDGKGIEMPKATIDYLRVVLERVIATEGEYILDLPEVSTRKGIAGQVAYQAGQLLYICTHQNQPISNLVVGLEKEDVLKFCLQHSDSEIAEAVAYIKSSKK